MAAHNGVLPKRYASCPAAGKDLEGMAKLVHLLAVVPYLQPTLAGGQFGLAASAALKQAPAPVAALAQTSSPPAASVGKPEGGKFFTTIVQLRRPIGCHRRRSRTHNKRQNGARTPDRRC